MVQDMREGVLNESQAQDRDQHTHCRDTATAVRSSQFWEGTELLGREKALTTPSTRLHTQTQVQKRRCDFQGASVAIEALGINQKEERHTNPRDHMRL